MLANKVSKMAFPRRPDALWVALELHKWPNPPQIAGMCLECAAIFGHQPLTIRWRLRGYTRVMMTKRILTICAAVSTVVAAGAAGTPLASAQQGYPVPPGAVYSPRT